MELCKVTFDYRKNPGADPLKEGALDRREVTAHVAVYGSYGSAMYEDAIKTAIRGVIGPDDLSAEYEPFVKSVEYLGSVHVFKPAAVEEAVPA